MTDQKAIEPVSMSDWVAPIILVLKADNPIRVYGDYKIAVITKLQ